MGILVGVIIGEATRKVIQTDNGQIPLDDSYSYQRGDIFKYYPFDGSELQAQLSNPAPGIKIHAEIGDATGSVVMQMISSEKHELLLLP